MSSHIHDCITRAKWYEISARSRKLLILMTLRSQVPCKLTAAKIMDLSIESFGVVKIESYYIIFFQKSNESLPVRFCVRIEYVIINEEKYYWLLFSLSSICVIFIIMVIICCDIMFISLVQHVCGIFAVIGFRIENSPTVDLSRETLTGPRFRTNSQDIHYKHFVSCIRDHRRALEFADLIEATFTGCFGIVVGLNLQLMSITAVQDQKLNSLHIMTQSQSIQDTVKYIMFTFAQMIHLFFDCYMSQRLTDMSAYIHQCIARAKWYENSARSRKLLILMTLKSQIPCKLTAGKVMELSIETFGMCLKTAGSYVTVLLSMR
ncbi:odorant receptor 67c-like [Cotesia glomerata]|uniref:odorant receptor 67c-like n=1 Tax=Cotesia glomerata TaxID=32391 RepID=UPI001D025E8E|nr:odorant receptor 67c-like [Cotesia glomerata]